MGRLLEAHRSRLVQEGEFFCFCIILFLCMSCKIMDNGVELSG